MSEKQVISTDKAPRAIGPYSAAIKVGEMTASEPASLTSLKKFKAVGSILMLPSPPLKRWGKLVVWVAYLVPEA